MKKIYVFKAGNTLGAHEKIVKKLTKRGAKVVEEPDDSLETVVFCPIVSRYETDINSALSSASGNHADTQMHKCYIILNVLSLSHKL